VIGSCGWFEEERERMVRGTEAEGLEGGELAMWMLRGGRRQARRLHIWDRTMDFLQRVRDQEGGKGKKPGGEDSSGGYVHG
jgi:hypothetical protein